MKDFYGRTINYLRISLTDKCNLRCMYCKPQCISNSDKVESMILPEEAKCFVRAFTELGGNKIRFTGGEPLIVSNFEEYIYSVAQIKNVDDISVTTNGILLEDKISDLKKAGLRRVNISLDTLNREKYKKITGVQAFDKVMRGIQKTIELNMKPVKIDAVLMKGINDEEIGEFIKFIEYHPVEVRFIELMPIGEGIKLFNENYISANEILRQHPELRSVGHNPGSVAELYQTERSKGKIGFISSISNKFCGECNRIRLTSDGKAKPCLHNSDEYPLIDFVRAAVKDGEDSEAYEVLKSEIKKVLLSKPLKHNLIEEGGSNSNSQRAMFQIGG